MNSLQISQHASGHWWFGWVPFQTGPAPAMAWRTRPDYGICTTRDWGGVPATHWSSARPPHKWFWFQSASEQMLGPCFSHLSRQSVWGMTEVLLIGLEMFWVCYWPQIFCSQWYGGSPSQTPFTLLVQYVSKKHFLIFPFDSLLVNLSRGWSNCFICKLVFTFLILLSKIFSFSATILWGWGEKASLCTYECVYVFSV